MNKLIFRVISKAISLVLFCVWGFGTAHAEEIYFEVDPKSSFYFAGPGDQTTAPLLIELGEFDIGTNQIIYLSISGEGLGGVGAVFSASDKLLGPDNTQRVVDAIPAGKPFIMEDSCSPNGGNQSQDFPEDFLVRDQQLAVVVPEGAKYLFVSVADCWHADNTGGDDWSLLLVVPDPVQSSVPTRRLDKLRRGLNNGGNFAFSDNLEARYISESDIKTFLADGFTHIRQFLYADNFIEPYASPELAEESMDLLEEVVGRYISAGMAVSLTLTSGSADSQSTNFDFLGTEQGWTSYLEFSRNLAGRFAGFDPDYLFFEVFNEPTDVTGEGTDCQFEACAPPIWRENQRQWIAAVREEAPEHTILVSAADFSNYPALMRLIPYDEPNLVYLFHYYFPHIFTFPFGTEDKVELHYPACMPENSGVLDKVNNENELLATELYLSEDWNASRIAEDFKKIVAWRNTYQVALINNEFAAWSLSGGFEGPPAADNRLRWLRDVRFETEKAGIAWNVYSFNVYYKSVGAERNRGPWEPVVDNLAAVGARPWTADEPPCLNIPTNIADVVVESRAIGNSRFQQSNNLVRYEISNEGPDDAQISSFRVALETEGEISFVSTAQGDCVIQSESAVCDAGTLSPGDKKPIIVGFRGAESVSQTSARVTAHEKDTDVANNHLKNTWQTNPASPVVIDQRMSGSYFDPSHDGEGWILEILEPESNTSSVKSHTHAESSVPGKALLYWFTYGKQKNELMWLIGSGSISGDSIFFPNLSRASGPKFGPEFSPEQLELNEWGDLIMSFGSPDEALVYWNSRTVGFGASKLNASKLTALVSSDDGTPLADENPGYSGSWYDPSHNGEGWIIEMLEGSKVVIYWFTFDDNGDQIWLVGIGNIDKNKITADLLIPTSGTSFGGQFDPSEIELSDWGSIEITFHSCSQSTLSYDSDFQEFGSGTLNPIRLTSLHAINCTHN